MKEKTAAKSVKKPASFKVFCKRNFGFVFIIVWLVGFLIFRLYPFASSFVYSFSDFHLFNGIKNGDL